jgi:hypothetical protein
MSNGHKMEFLVETENQTSLYYWDWINGTNDTIFVLRDGKAYKQEGANEVECDLPKELLQLAKSVDEQVKRFYEGRNKP